MSKDLTWGDINRKFFEKNPNLKNKQVDYRPYKSPNTIIMWFDNKIGIITKYNEDTDSFELLQVDKDKDLDWL